MMTPDLFALLKKIEWGSNGEVGTCPACHRDQAEGHARACELRVALVTHLVVIDEVADPVDIPTELMTRKPEAGSAVFITSTPKRSVMDDVEKMRRFAWTFRHALDMIATGGNGADPGTLARGVLTIEATRDPAGYAELLREG